VRVALGATPSHLRQIVVREGGAIATAGIAAGLVVTIVLSRVLSSLLFGVGPTDPPTYGAVSLGLLAVVLLASLGPARRATAADPVRAIRAE
jgi:ABC-type antimicrobial peptide transport system permease subunit